MLTLLVTLTSHGPLLMSAPTMLNRRDPLTQELTGMFAVNNKNKTQEHLDREEQLQFLTASYIDKVLGPYLPAPMVRACAIAGARVTKHGKDVENGVTFLEDKIKLEYVGPRDPDGLWKARDRFVDFRPVMRGRVAVMCVRPKFSEWTATFEVSLDPVVIDAADFAYYMAVGGRLKGIGAYRSMYGRFTVSVNGKTISANDPPGSVMTKAAAPATRKRETV
jgi:hypothetical protein